MGIGCSGPVETIVCIVGIAVISGVVALFGVVIGCGLSLVGIVGLCFAGGIGSDDAIVVLLSLPLFVVLLFLVVLLALLLFTMLFIFVFYMLLLVLVVLLTLFHQWCCVCCWCCFWFGVLCLVMVVGDSWCFWGSLL